MLCIGYGLSVNVHRDFRRAVSQEFLHNLYVFAVGVQQRCVGVPKRMPRDLLPDPNPLGSWLNVILHHLCQPQGLLAAFTASAGRNLLRLECSWTCRGNSDTSSPDALIARFFRQFKSSQWPSGLPLPNVYCCGQQIVQKGKPGSLHAKCIVVDGAHVFVSSANFTEAAQERNIEVGLLIQSRALAERVRRFFDALLDSSYFGRAI